MSDFIKVPESDYQGETPTINPLIVTLQFDKPLEHEVNHGGRTWINYNYKVDHEGTEHTLSASKGLSSHIEKIGAIKDTKIKIIKKRIGPAAKDIRWVVAHVDGPVDTSKAKSSVPSRPAENKSVASAKPLISKTAEKEYSPLTEEALKVWKLNQSDEASLLAVSLKTAAELWESLGYTDVDPKAIQATAASLHIQGGRTTGGLKGLNNLLVPDPIKAITLMIVATDMPQSFYDAVSSSSAWFDDSEDIVNLMKELGFTSVPKAYKEQYAAIALLMEYGDLMFDEADHQSALDTVKEKMEDTIDEPAF